MVHSESYDFLCGVALGFIGGAILGFFGVAWVSSVGLTPRSSLGSIFECKHDNQRRGSQSSPSCYLSPMQRGRASGSTKTIFSAWLVSAPSSLSFRVFENGEPPSEKPRKRDVGDAEKRLLSQNSKSYRWKVPTIDPSFGVRDALGTPELFEKPRQPSHLLTGRDSGSRVGSTGVALALSGQLRSVFFGGVEEATETPLVFRRGYNSGEFSDPAKARRIRTPKRGLCSQFEPRNLDPAVLSEQGAPRSKNVGIAGSDEQPIELTFQHQNSVQRPLRPLRSRVSNRPIETRIGSTPQKSRFVPENTPKSRLNSGSPGLSQTP